MRTIAVINLKGGVAKTVTTNSVAYILASQGNKVLIVDNDKQGDASRGLNCRTQDGEGIDRIMTARHPEDWMKKLIRHTEFHNMDEEFRKINCKYTKVNLNTEKLPEDKDGKVEQLLNKLGIIQANRFREKSDWEKMQEALITEEVIKELRDLVDLQGTTRKMVQATLGTSGTQLERYHAIQKKLDPELMQEFKNAKINISVARELTDLDEKHQKEALELYQKNGAITLPDVKTLKEKQEVGRQVPGQLTLAEATGQNRPPEDDTVIDVDVQIERFFESLKKATTERILKRDKNMSIYMLSTIYDGVRIRNGYLNYQGRTNGILFNPDSDKEVLFTWQQLAETLIEAYGRKPKPVKLAPLPEHEKECPRYDADEVFTPDIARMLKIFLEDVYAKMYVGATRRFRAMGAEFAVVQRVNEKDFVFYDEKGEKVCFVSADRMRIEHQKRVVDATDLKKPSKEEEKYLDNLARKLIGDFAEWFKQDFHKRVLNVVTSPDELKEKLGSSRTWHFDTGIGIGHANLFDDYVQVWNEGNKCLGNYDWFYLAASIQKMWNEIAMEEAETARLKMVEETVENVSDSDKPECCQQAAETTDERQQDTEGNQSLVHDCQEEELKQEPLDIMGNDIERKAWLRSYKLWGLWYEDKHIGVRYYKYDFENGTRLIVEEYDPDLSKKTQWYEPKESYYMHLVGGPEPDRKNQIPKWTYHAKYNKYPNSETELVEFLKALQRGIK